MTLKWKFVMACCVVAYTSASGAVDRQIGVDPALATGYSQLTGGALAPWALARGSLAAGYWQRASGAAQGVGSNNVATVEFQLPEVQPTRIRSATYQFSGRYSQCAGDEPVVFDVHAYPADGRADIADVTAGTPLTHSLSVSLIDDSSFEAIRQASARFANQATRETASKVAVPKL